MVRAVVHKTRGKLDLRSLTIFGLNAKPATDTPIGYFGTGLKYAVAVLARNNIPVTFWIDGKRWTIEQDDTKFRDKSFRALSLVRDRGKMMPRKILALPFTTELGKNWELWQAFRELEANTRDEKGITELCPDSTAFPISRNVYDTWIVVQDERYTECFLSRDQYFLPDGLTAREPRSMSDRIQVFARKSKAVYYRSIRILDLKEPSENTYNILAPITLTEDRTAKSEFDVMWEIQNCLGASNNAEIIRRAVSAPPKTFERKFDYEYSARSEAFLDTVASVGEDATEHARSILRRDRPPEEPTEAYANWIRDLIAAIKGYDLDRIGEHCKGNKDELVNILRAAAEAKEKEDANNSQGYGGEIEIAGGPCVLGKGQVDTPMRKPMTKPDKQKKTTSPP